MAAGHMRFRGQYVKSTTKFLAFGLAGGAAIAISGCGSSSGPKEPGAASLAKSAMKSVGKAKSVHVDGVEPDNGLPVNLSINSAGDMSGTIRLDGANTEIIRVKGNVYLKLTSGILRQYNAPASACPTVCGHWVKLSRTEASLLAGPYTMSSLNGDIVATSLSKVTDAGSAKVGSQAVWVVTEINGTIVYLSQKATHYPLEVKPATGSSGVMEYSQWNAVPTPKAPPASQIVSQSSLR
jgi:hypothetical protein